MEDDDPDPSARRLTPPSHTSQVPLLWALVALALALLTTEGALLLLRAARGPIPPFLTDPSAAEAAPAKPPAAAEPGALQIAGSGSNLPLTRALVVAFRARNPGARITVHESIDTAGGIRAVRDGAIQVGLASRPLADDETRLGLVATAYARVAVVVGANESVPDTCTSKEELVGMYAGTRARWSDGSRVVVLQRERRDSSLLVFGHLVPGVLAENDASYRERRWRVLFSDLALQEALLETEGSVSIFDLGAIDARRLPLKVLCVDGVVPSTENMLSGRYPFTKDLAFVTPGAPAGLGAELIRFALSSAGREIIVRLGYAPLAVDAPPGGAAPP